jgi:hypothetical protein
MEKRYQILKLGLLLVAIAGLAMVAVSCSAPGGGGAKGVPDIKVFDSTGTVAITAGETAHTYSNDFSFKIRNLGNSDLEFPSTPIVLDTSLISIALVPDPLTVRRANEEADVTLSGFYCCSTATVDIHSNDPDEPIFSFTVNFAAS